MNTTEYFKRTIQAYLEERAMEDELFAAKYDNPDKNIDDCVTYILNWVQKSGCNGFCDDEIYGQAIHYYEEKDIEVGKPLNCQVSVNHHIELTEEEKAQARQEAIRQYQQEQMNKMRNRDTAKRTSQRTETEVHQPSSIMSNEPFNNIRYEHYRIFQENHTSLFGGACNGGRTLCSQV